MDYKCLECGHVFEHGDEHWWRESSGEEFTGCPKCGCAYEETVNCKVCHGDYLDDELFSGVCKACLLETMTAVNLAQYLRDGDMEEDAYIGMLFDTDEIVSILREVFLHSAALETGLGKENTLQKCRNYVNDDDTGLWDYAQWYAARQKTAITR